MSLNEILIEFKAKAETYKEQLRGIVSDQKQVEQSAKQAENAMNNGFVTGADGAKRFDREVKRNITTQAELELKLKNLNELLRDEARIGTEAHRAIQREVVKTQAQMNKLHGIGDDYVSLLKKMAATAVTAFSVAKVIAFAKESMKAYNVQVQAEQQLLVALKGRVSLQQDLIKQAQELQAVTLFGDEATIGAQATLAALGLEADAIKQLIPLVQDLAAAKGIDLKSAAQVVGQAASGTSDALKRQLGISIKDATTDAARLTAVMEGLNNAVGGQAKAAAEEGTGAVAQMTNAWGDATEAIGKSIGAFAVFVSSSRGVKGAIQAVTDGANTFADVMLSRAITSTEKWAYALSFLNVNTGAITRAQLKFRIELEQNIRQIQTANTEEGILQLTRSFTMKQLVAMRDAVKEGTQEHKNLQQAVRILAEEESKQATAREAQQKKLIELQNAKRKAFEEFLQVIRDNYAIQQELDRSLEESGNAMANALRKEAQLKAAQAAQDKADTDAFRKLQEEKMNAQIEASDQAFLNDEKNRKAALKAEQDALRERRQAYQDFALSVSQLGQAILNEELQRQRFETDARIRNLRQRFDAGLISEEQYNKQVLVLQREQFEAEKKAARGQALINGALAITNIISRWAANPPVAALLSGIAATTTAVQVSAINQQTPGFEKGGYTGDVGTKQVAGVVHGKEFVSTAKHTKQHRGLLEAIHADKAEDYIRARYILPELLQKSRAGFDDTGLIHAIKKNRVIKLHPDSLRELAAYTKAGESNVLARRRW